MRTETEIRSRIRDLVSQELDRRIQEASERLPHRCIYNYKHPLDTRKYVEGDWNESYNRITLEDGSPVTQRIGLCLLGSEDPEEWGGTICDEPIDAKKCPYFTPAKGKDDLIPELEENLRDSVWVEEHLPGVHALIWVLGELSLHLPWWRKFLFKFKVIRIEPVLPPIDPSKLLTP